MRADDWIVDFLINKGVTDVFGVPGVVVMDFLYAVDKRKPEITPHLNYHEQGASFAACGYAQTTGRLGVAYSTRGPGLTNMITAMADAYYDSVPVMFITAHSAKKLESNMRVMYNQEIDTVSLVKHITKFAVRIDAIEELQNNVVRACQEAMTGRKGPVFLDIWNELFSVEVDGSTYAVENNVSINDTENVYDEKALIPILKERLNDSKHPIILIGNGARDNKCKEKLRHIADKFKIPILSSRVGQDIVPNSQYYFGFVGSRATRYSNFILSKADLIIAIGNRLSFPIKSKSFIPIVENALFIRIDVDDSEFVRKLPNSLNFKIDSLRALSLMENNDLHYNNSNDWIDICKQLKGNLDYYDKNIVINNIMKIIELSESDATIVCDVGNHSFWVTTAYSYFKATNRIMYSGSFGTLGSALPKAIGAYYATRKSVICFAGDQGIQFNIQELQYISMHSLPIKIVVLNNSSSGMIMERELAKHGEYLIHTTINSGYGYPSFEKLADCFGIKYIRVEATDIYDLNYDNVPCIIELIIEQNTILEPSLPIGKPCQDLSPELSRELYDRLNNL